MRKISRLVYLIGITITVDASGCCVAQSTQNKEQEASEMTKTEEALLREIVKDGISTHIREDGGREVALRNDLIKLHNAKRRDAIKVLLSIVKDGRTVDAHTAGVAAIALEEGPGAAVGYVDIDVATFDVLAVDNETDRQKFVKIVANFATKAEKQTQDKKK